MVSVVAVRLGIQSVDMAANLLKVMVQIDRAAALRDIARSAGLHPAKVHRYLVSLVRAGLASQDPATGMYGLGAFAVQLGLAALRQNDVISVASLHLNDVQTAPAQSVILTAWGGTAPTIVRRIEDARSPVYRHAAIGSALPLFGSASGLAFAAYLPESLVERFLHEEVQRITDAKTAQRHADTTAHVLRRVRRDGYARVRDQFVAGTASLAAPVFEADGNVGAVVAVIGRTAELGEDLEARASKRLLECTGKMSLALGYTGAMRPISATEARSVP